MSQQKSWTPSTLLLAGLLSILALSWCIFQVGPSTSITLFPRHTKDWLSSNAQPQHDSKLTKRADYTCSADAPCSNGACCGASGFAGM